MKHILNIVFILLTTFAFPQIDLAFYDFNICDNNPEYVFPYFNATPVTTTVPLSSGCNVSINDGCATGCGLNPGCTTNTSFITKSWTGSVRNPSNYYEFTVSTYPGVSFYLYRLSFDFRRSSTGPTNLAIYMNGVSQSIYSFSSTGCVSFDAGINSLVTGLANFKIYFWNGGSGGTMRIDNLKLTHTFTTLPIELVSFNAYLNNNKVDLEWVTASEIDNSHFEIEKSLNGIEFHNISRVDAVGYSQHNTSYSYTDFNINKNEGVYYRLKQVDYNGVYTYSNIVYVIGANNIFLNKTKIYDLSGKLVNQEHLSPGFYLLEVNGKIKKFFIL